MPKVVLSPSNRAECRRCKEKILKNTYRIGVSVGAYGHCGGYYSTHWYHTDCYPKAEGVRPSTVSSGLKGFAKIPKGQRRKIRKALWPNLVGNQRKSRIKPLKEIQRMNVKELKFELERRDLKRNGNKLELKRRLKRFLRGKQCKKANKAISQRKTMQKSKQDIQQKHHLNLPVFVKQIVYRYYPKYI